MADRTLEQILSDEHRRLTRGGGASKSPVILGTLSAIPGTRVTPSAIQARPADQKPMLAAAPTPTAGASINKGYTLPAPPKPQAEATKGSSVAGEIGKTALTLFTSGLGVMPLVSGLAGLFGGGESQAPPPLTKYAMPRSIHITAANSRSGGSLSLADHSQDGTVRSSGGIAEAAAPSAPMSQVVVNVQAMDSRSFLDHSQEIAQAVREAMLNMHALNDVVGEL
jgi:hypothetical protein